MSDSPEIKILIVDDEKEVVALLDEFLKNSGFQTECAYDGDEALKKYDEFKPDLLLLDLKMPKLTGYDVCRELHETRACKIIIITGYPNELVNVKKYLELGVSDCIIKPFDLNTLLSKVHRYLDEDSSV